MRSVLLRGGKRKEVDPRVVEDSVKNNPNPACVAGIHEFTERRFIAEMRIDDPVVRRLIFVIGIRSEDGIQVERIDAEGGDVVEVLEDATQVSPEIIPRRRLPSPFLRPRRIVRYVAVREPLGENLVEDRVLDPRRGSTLVLG